MVPPFERILVYEAVGGVSEKTLSKTFLQNSTAINYNAIGSDVSSTFLSMQIS
jgi:hypothetical protein